MIGYGWGMGFAGWIFMGLFWVVIIGLVIWAVMALLPGARSSRSAGQDTTGRDTPRETPEDILDRRFAAGEIDAEQYRKARDELAATRSLRR